MSGQVSLESSLRRSSRLGQEVLDRAKRRSEHWSSSSSSGNEDLQPAGNKGYSNSAALDEAFTTIEQFMKQTTKKCKNYHKSQASRDLNEWERLHVHRYHPHERPRTSTLTIRKHKRVAQKDLRVVVSPGTYTFTASVKGSKTPTQLVHIVADEKTELTFNL